MRTHETYLFGGKNTHEYCNVFQFRFERTASSRYIRTDDDDTVYTAERSVLSQLDVTEED